MKKLLFLLTFFAFALSLSAQTIKFITYTPYKTAGIKGLLTEHWSDGKTVQIRKSTDQTLLCDEIGYKTFFNEDGSIYTLTFKSALESEYLASIEKFDQWMNPLYRQVCQYEPKFLTFKSEIDNSVIKINLSPLVLAQYQCQESKADGSAYWECGDESPYDIETTNGKIVAIRDTRNDVWYNRLD